MVIKIVLYFLLKVRIMEKIFNHIDQHIEETIETLFKMVSQPSVSAQNYGFDKAPNLIKNILSDYGLNSQLLNTPNNGNPSIFGEFKSNSNKTLMFYTHYDVMPAEPLELWESDPFKPEKRGNRLYGRGMSDDKGNIAARLAAIKAFLDIENKLPTNLKFFIEGEEEIGSRNLLGLIETYKPILKADACIWEGGGVNMSGSPLIYIGLKGGLTIKMSVNKLSVDAHSSYSPILPSSIDRLTKAMNSMKNDLGQIIIEGFHDAIIDLNKEQREAINSLPDDTKEWEDKFGVKLLGTDLESIDDLNMKLYSEPTANVNSIQSGYNGPGMKSVVPAYAECKMDFRLVPNQNPAEIYEYIKKHLIKKGFSDIEIEPLHQIFPFRTDMNSDLLDIVKTSAFEIYNKKPLVTPNMAGSGPMYEFGGLLKMPICSAGVDHPTHNMHAPNENITIDDLSLGAKHIALIMKRFAEI